MNEMYSLKNKVFKKETKTVRINVGGIIFKCYAETLERFEGSLLATLDHNDEHYDGREEEYFFDRNPVIFQYILDSYRTGSLHIPGDMCGSKFKEELEFWGLSECVVSRCCWEALYMCECKVQTIQTLDNFYEGHFFIGKTGTRDGLRRKIWHFLHEPQSSRSAKIWGVFISFIIALSVMVSAVESVPYARTRSLSEAENATFNRIVAHLTGNSTRGNTFFANFYKAPHVLLQMLDTFCFVVLTLELILVFCFSPRRSELLKCWLHMSEVVCSLAYWFYFVCAKNMDKIESIHLMRAMIVSKYLTILKLVRLFRIARHISALKIMGLTIWLSMYELFVLGLMLFILTSFFGLLMYASECTDNNTFDNVFTAMYWALITITTVGYGDYTPSTPAGHVVASACAVCGIIMLALPIGIFASNFNNLYHHHQYVFKHIVSCRGESAKGDTADINKRIAQEG